MQVQESYVRDLLRLFVWLPLRWIIGLLPTDAAFRVFRAMGRCHFRFARRKRREIAERIAGTLQRSRRQGLGIAEKYFENHYLDRLHIFMYPRLTASRRAAPFIRFENRERFDDIRRQQRGVLIVQPHFGPVQLTLLQLALLGYQPLQIGLPSDNGLSRRGRLLAFRYRLKYERMIPAPIIAADHFLGRAYRHLAGGGVVLTTGDGAGGGVYLGEHRAFDFLGRRQLFPLGPASLAIKTRAVFLPTFIVHERSNAFKIVFEAPIVPRYHDLARDKIHMTETFLRVAERYVRAYPHCWHFWDEIQDRQ